MADAARMEAEIDRLGTALDLQYLALAGVKDEARKALDLVREAGDCLLLQNTPEARTRIQQASVVLYKIAGTV